MFLVALLFFLLGILSMLPWVVCCDTIAIFFLNPRKGLFSVPPIAHLHAFSRMLMSSGLGVFWRFGVFGLSAMRIFSFVGCSGVWSCSILASATVVETAFLATRGGILTSLCVRLDEFHCLGVYVVFSVRSISFFHGDIQRV